MNGLLPSNSLCQYAPLLAAPQRQLIATLAQHQPGSTRGVS
jgi:hypothetical protein